MRNFKCILFWILVSKLNFLLFISFGAGSGSILSRLPPFLYESWHWEISELKYLWNTCGGWFQWLWSQSANYNVFIQWKCHMSIPSTACVYVTWNLLFVVSKNGFCSLWFATGQYYINVITGNRIGG